ncbi:2-dehydropantoate 2-reductase [Pontibacterium sp. N1Y112]|uniref:2-dehydropantoate 2-reductase n=2 Tax=Pontibacterium sinense TaxID=2781979 RepID=A0A8J7FCP1_9GAMM|nr:2-dehydropantoate 2-reductase [Pontibacterium sinense]
MRFLMIGAGGIGAYYAARLLEAGHEVVLTARGPHLTALQNDGLTVEHPEFSFQGPVTAMDHATLIATTEASQFDLIAISLKAGATESVLNELESWLTDQNTPILSLQNGVDNEPAIANAIGNQRTIGGLAVRIGGHIIKPGVIEAKGPAQVVMGAWPNAKQTPELQQQLQPLADTLNDAHIPTTLTDDIQYQLWRKLIINNGVNPLSALTLLDTQKLTHHPAYGKAVYRMMEETAKAAKADNVPLTKADVDEMFELISTFDAIKTSMLVDREKGRPLELEEICGAVLRRCAALGEDAPTTELVQALLKQELQNNDSE